MKRFIKKQNRKGFTLVETILAVFILFVVSTMLVNGFIAAIAYSYQTSIYSKSGSVNYDVCMTSVADWSMKEVGTRESIAAGPVGAGATKTTLSFQRSGVHAKTLEGVNIILEKNESLQATVPLELNFADGRFAPAENANQLSDNRKTFKYYPEYCQVAGRSETIGHIIVVHDKKNNKYYWTVDTEKTDPTKWIAEIT